MCRKHSKCGTHAFRGKQMGQLNRAKGYAVRRLRAERLYIAFHCQKIKASLPCNDDRQDNARNCDTIGTIITVPQTR